MHVLLDTCVVTCTLVVSSSCNAMSEIAQQGLFNGELAAGGVEDFSGKICLHKPEAVAESVPLSDHRINVYRAQRKSKFQLHDFVQGNFNGENGRDSRFADVHGTALQVAAAARIDGDLGLKLEPGLAAIVDRV